MYISMKPEPLPFPMKRLVWIPFPPDGSWIVSIPWENARDSTGLGLSIAKMLSQQMGGSLKSEYHDGRLFIILSFPEDSQRSSV